MSMAMIQAGKPNARLVSHVTGLAQLAVLNVLLRGDETVRCMSDSERANAMSFGRRVLEDYGAALYRKLLPAFRDSSEGRALDWLKINEMETWAAREVIISKKEEGAPEALIEFSKAVITEIGELMHTVAMARLQEERSRNGPSVGYG